MKKSIIKRIKLYPVYSKELEDILYQIEYNSIRNKKSDPMLSKTALFLQNELENIKAELENAFNEDVPLHMRRKYKREHMFLKSRYIENLSLEKVAEKLNISRTTVFRISASLGCRKADEVS